LFVFVIGLGWGSENDVLVPFIFATGRFCMLKFDMEFAIGFRGVPDAVLLDDIDHGFDAVAGGMLQFAKDCEYWFW
jgi:hypothetical protein